LDYSLLFVVVISLVIGSGLAFSFLFATAAAVSTFYFFSNYPSLSFIKRDEYSMDTLSLVLCDDATGLG